MPAGKAPPRRRSQPVAARPSLLRRSARAAGGALALLAGALAARPVLSGGSAAFAVLTGLIASNALYSQPSAHPQPLMATRGEVNFTRPAATANGAAQSAQMSTPAVWQPVNDPRVMTVPLVEEVQLLLQQAGYYESEIDGRPGQATDRAIRRFQAERSLRIDGMATPLLLAQIRQMTASVPSPDQRPGGDQVAGLIEGLDDSGLETGAIAAAGPAPELVRDIQSELTAARVAELTADGILGERTRAAIRTFQALEGLDVTGEPSQPLLSRLREVTGRG